MEVVCEIFGIIVLAFAVAGVILNNHLRIECFYFWLVSNFLSAILHLHYGSYSLFARDSIFFVLCIHGIYKWQKSAKPKKKDFKDMTFDELCRDAAYTTDRDR